MPPAPTASHKGNYLRQRLGKNLETESRKRISRLIEPFTDILEAEDLAEESDSEDWQEVLTPTTFYRRIGLNERGPVEVDDAVILNELAALETELLKEGQDMALSRHFEASEDGDETGMSNSETQQGALTCKMPSEGKYLVQFKVFRDNMWQ
jgi:hypothetical protein